MGAILSALGGWFTVGGVVVGGTALSAGLVFGGTQLAQPKGGDPTPAGDSIVQYSDS
jgi:hypothetical protein